MTMRITGSTSGSTAGYGSPASLSAAGDSGFLRTAYYPGQFLTDRDLSADQAYAAEKRRVENRSLHGHGVVTGLQVELAATPGWVNIRPGLALDPFGNEIRVLQALQADLRAKLDEALRRRAYAAASTTASVIVALQYDERAVDPQPAFVPQTSVDAPNKAARTREGYKLVLLLESDLDAAARKVLYWQADLLSATRTPDSVLTTAEVDCPYVFLATVSKNGEAYSVDTSVQRPVLGPEVFFKLVREYAPDLFTGASSVSTGRAAVAAQAPALVSPPLVAAARAAASSRLGIFQQALGTALVASAIHSMPLSARPVTNLEHPDAQKYLQENALTTLGGVIDAWEAIAAKLGDSAGGALTSLEQTVQSVAGAVGNVLGQNRALTVSQTLVQPLVRSLGLNEALVQQILSDAEKLMA